ncbi:Rho GTPase activation protein [Amylostereum chailletii]|nr:Rho GTPase activation protein [Amylostereum chailletii]
MINVPEAPKWPYTDVLVRLKNILRLDGRNVKDYIDLEDYEAMYRADVQERERREATRSHIARMRAGLEPSEFAQDTHVFAAPLNETVLIASRTVILNGARHDLPIVLFACTEELYRTGIYKSGLFRDLPDRRRHMELIRAFNSAPSFGEGLSLSDEDTAVVGSVLSTYLKNLPEPLIGDPLFEPLWNWCIRPSVQREEARLKREESDDENAREQLYSTGRKTRRPSRREITERRKAHAAEDEVLDARQVPAVQCLLRLLPTHRLSMLVYVCTFFSQVPLCPENGMTLDDLARMFAPPLLGGPRPAAKHMLVWFLKNWTKISEGLLDPGLGPDIAEMRPRRRVEDEEDEDEEVEAGTLVKASRSPYGHKRRGSRDSRSRLGPSGSSSESTLAGSGEWDVDAMKKGKRECEDPRPVVMLDPVPPSRSRRSFFRRGSQSDLLPPHVFKTMPALSPIDSASCYSDSVDPLRKRGSEADWDKGELRVQLQIAREERDEAWRVVNNLRDMLDQVHA